MLKRTLICSIIIVILLGVIYFLTTIDIKNGIDFEKYDGKHMAIIFIGGLKDSYNYDTVNNYFSSKDFKVVTTGGEERYLIIPKDNISVDVYSLTIQETGKTKEEFVQSIDEPFYLDCNMSDIFPNSKLVFKIDDKEYNYSPYISLKDGSVVVEEFVVNIDK